MPRLWTDTIASHRESVHDAVLDAAVALVAQKGVAGLTMAELAASSGIGRATLYKYFPSIGAVLAACHTRQVDRHVAELSALGADLPPRPRLEAVLRGYAERIRDTAATHAAAGLTVDAHAAHVRDGLTVFVADLIRAAAAEGDVRSDIPAAELADYCVHALDAATSMHSRAAVGRLIGLVTAGLYPETPEPRRADPGKHGPKRRRPSR